MARDFRTERIDAQCAANGARGAVQSLGDGGVRRDATLWNHLEGRINALLIRSDLLLLRHVDS
jgi:hypothetical protein